MRAYDLEAVLDLLNEQNTKSRIELFDRLIMFNEFVYKLIIKYLHKKKKIEIRPIDTDLKEKVMAYSPLLPFTFFSKSEFINIDTMNIISSDVEID